MLGWSGWAGVITPLNPTTALLLTDGRLVGSDISNA